MYVWFHVPSKKKRGRFLAPVLAVFPCGNAPRAPFGGHNTAAIFCRRVYRPSPRGLAQSSKNLKERPQIHFLAHRLANLKAVHPQHHALSKFAVLFGGGHGAAPMCLKRQPPNTNPYQSTHPENEKDSNIYRPSRIRINQHTLKIK